MTSLSPPSPALNPNPKSETTEMTGTESSVVESMQTPSKSRRVLPVSAANCAPSPLPSTSSRKTTPVPRKTEPKKDMKLEPEKDTVKVKSTYVPNKWQSNAGGKERGGASLGALSSDELPVGAPNCFEV